MRSITVSEYVVGYRCPASLSGHRTAYPRRGVLRAPAQDYTRTLRVDVADSMIIPKTQVVYQNLMKICKLEIKSL